VILGSDSYTLATVTAGEIERPSTLPEVENIGFRMQLVTFQIKKYEISIIELFIYSL